jgi:hypothetical protein
MNSSDIIREVQHGSVDSSQDDRANVGPPSVRPPTQNGAGNKVKPPSLVDEKVKSSKDMERVNGPGPRETQKQSGNDSSATTELVSTGPDSLSRHTKNDSNLRRSFSYTQVRDEKRNEDEHVAYQNQQAIRSEAPSRSQGSIPMSAKQSHDKVWPLLPSPKTPPVQRELADVRYLTKPSVHNDKAKPKSSENRRAYNPSPQSGVRHSFGLPIQSQPYLTIALFVCT